MKVLLTGSKGQVGRCLQDKLPVEWIIHATDSGCMDITDEIKVASVVRSFQPDVIINAAAYTAVDKAESEKELAKNVNALGPFILAKEALKIKARFFHISTDYVFDGESLAPYTEESETNPLNIYGLTKLKGETLVRAVFPEAHIIRTAWVFSEYGNNFVKTMLRLSNSNKFISVVDDQFGCPTYAGHLAQTIIKMININATGGIYHFCGDERVSWSQFAEKIFFYAYMKNIIDKKTIVKNISTSQFPTLAKRPKYSALSCDKIAGLNIKPSEWNLALMNIIDKC
jgi:dTDP-4-dehydrorhamnose reductase